MRIKQTYFMLVATATMILLFVSLPHSIKNTSRELVTGRKGENATSGKLYLLVLRYSGQQGAGVNAITSLQCWAGQLNRPVKIIEPAILTTEIVTSPSLRDSNAMDLSEYFDMSYLNSASSQAGYAQIISRREYLKAKPKNAVMLHIGSEGFTWSSNKTGKCFKFSHPYEALNQYCVVEIGHSTSDKLITGDFMKLISNRNDEGLAVIIPRWMGRPYIPSCVESFHTKRFQFHPSERLLRDAQRYTEMYMGNSSSYTAIMLRLEHAAILGEKQPDRYSIDKCLQHVIRTANSVKQQLQYEIPMIAADIGKYGSNTFHWAVKNKEQLPHSINSTKSTMGLLLNHKLNFEGWEKSFIEAAGGVTNRGYIAALQRTIASHAQCLILMGGGIFQDLALQEYVRLHTIKAKRCIHYVCVDNRRLLDSRS